ncbi:hypothetical protein ACFL1M_00525 [Patescibacteria group bacterium]
MIRQKTKNFTKSQLLIILFALIGIVFFAISKPRKSEKSNQNFKMNRHFQNFVFFNTEVIGNQDRTQIYIPFSFEKKHIDLWFGYYLEEKQPKEWLIYHPQLFNLSWDKILENEISLYQKEKKYESVKDFLENPSGEIYADTYIIGEYERLDAKPLYTDLNLEEIDYIITTEIPVRFDNGTFYYENIINSTEAVRNSDDQVKWYIRAPSATEDNAFYLGNIDITYLQ